MTVEEWALIASVVFTGMWSGLLAMLTAVIHPMLARMDGPDFARFLQAFLPTARTAPFNYAAVLGMTVAPVIALFGSTTRGATLSSSPPSRSRSRSPARSSRQGSPPSLTMT